MLDYTNYNYRDRPFTRTNKFGIHPLSQTGHHEYVCRDSQVHWFMHKVPPRLLQELYGSKDSETCERTAEQEGYNPTADGTYQEFDSEKLAGPVREDLEGNGGNETDHEYDYTKTWERPIGAPSNYNQFYSSKPFTSSGGFRKTGGSVTKNRFTKDSRFVNDYVNEVQLLKTHGRFNATSTGMRKKRYDGFTSYQVPRTEHEYKEEFRKSRIVSDRVYNSIYNPTCSQNVDINEENDRLKGIFMNQTNKNFLKSNQLPHISLIVNQPKTLLKKTNTSATKMMGGKYNPFNYHGNSKNWTKRNYLGALYQH
jgi:hypothetical protein